MEILLLRSTPKDGTQVRLVPGIPDEAIGHAVGFDIGKKLSKVSVIVAPVAVVARVRGRAVLCPVASVKIMG